MNRSVQRGSQAVEFGLVLPFMILTIFAVLDFAFLGYNKAVITNASREAARRGIILTTAAWDADAIAQVACNYARNSVITLGTGSTAADCSGSRDPVITVTPVTPPDFNEPVTVTVAFTTSGFRIANWMGMGTTGIGEPVTLSATTEMNHE